MEKDVEKLKATALEYFISMEEVEDTPIEDLAWLIAKQKEKLRNEFEPRLRGLRTQVKNICEPFGCKGKVELDDEGLKLYAKGDLRFTTHFHIVAVKGGEIIVDLTDFKFSDRMENQLKLFKKQLAAKQG